jgi:Erv1 / Alr family/Mimivirus sulfhydryl oxidase R596-like, C-terminal domain
METEGLYTTIWGPAQWQSLHNITFNYPYEPTSEDKNHYYNYFFSLGNVLPCCTCRNHYNYHIRNGETKLTHDHLENRDTLTLWLYNLHKAVCERLGFQYDITYDMICKKHNSYIAKCDMNAEQKKYSYKHMYDEHAPVVSKDKLLCLANYAENRGLNKKKFINDINYYSSLDRESNEWFERNQKCQEQIKFMRINGIENIELKGEYKNLPTVEELKLMQLTSTKIPEKNINGILKQVGCKVKKTFEFVKL